MRTLITLISRFFTALGTASRVVFAKVMLPLIRYIYPPAGNPQATAKEKKQALLSLAEKIARPHQKFPRRAFIILIMLLLGLEMFGVLDPIRRGIDNETFSIAIGSVYLSLYVIVKSILWVILLLWAASHLNVIIDEQLKKMTDIHPSNRNLIFKILQFGIYTIFFLIVMNILGINLTSLTLFSGAVGIGIGFGLQKIAANLMSGLILTFERTLAPGTLVELENGRIGYIRKISIRYTLLETIDGLEVLIPNEELVTNKVTNWTLNSPEVRGTFLIGVSYDSDIELAQKLILESIKESPKVSKNKDCAVFLKDFGDNAVIFETAYWVSDIHKHRRDLRSDILFAIWHRFKEHHISIPYPQLDLHLTNAIRMYNEKSQPPKDS